MTIKVPKVEKFLYIFDLKLGALILGYIGTICNAGYTFLLLLDLVYEPKRFKHEVLRNTRIVQGLSQSKELKDAPALSEEKVSTTRES